MIAHVVLFQPRQNVTVDERRTFLAALQRAVALIPELKRARVGRTLELGVMPNQDVGYKTYQYAALFEFEDRAGLQAYLEHEAHGDVRQLFWSLCEATLIADIELVEPADWEAKLLVGDIPITN